MEHTTESESCAVCGYYRTDGRRVQIGGAPRRVCRICARFGKTLRQLGVGDLVEHCLHLFAMELERQAESGDWDLSSLTLPGKYQARLSRRLESGELCAACECERCRGRKLDAAEVVIFSDMFDLFDVSAEVPGDEMPLQLLRSFKDSECVVHADGSEWRAVDEIARRLVQNAIETKRGPLSALASSAMPVGPRVLSDAAKETLDHQARLAWRCHAKFGQGYVDGAYWVDLDGVCHPVSDA